MEMRGRIVLVVLAAGIALGGFLFGVTSAHKFPEIADPTYDAMKALGHLGGTSSSPSAQPQPSASPTPPLSEMTKNTFEVSSAEPGLTGTILLGLRSLTVPNYPPRIVEVERDGDVVWEYRVKEPGSYLMDIRKLPNGHVLFSLPQLVPGTSQLRAGKVVEVDHSGKIVREYKGDVTHHAEYLPGGDLLVADDYDDIATEVDSSNRVVWSWSAVAHAERYGPNNFVGFGPYGLSNLYDAQGKADFFHLNSVQRLPNGNTVISLRNADMVVEVNHAGDVVWSYGPLVLKHQHCAFVLPNDHLLVTDNGNARVIEVDRQTHKIVWEYRTDLKLPIQGCAYRLPSGDTLITDSAHRRVVEVSRAGKVVWRLDVKTPGTTDLYRAFWSPS